MEISHKLVVITELNLILSLLLILFKYIIYFIFNFTTNSIYKAKRQTPKVDLDHRKLK